MVSPTHTRANDPLVQTRIRQINDPPARSAEPQQPILLVAVTAVESLVELPDPLPLGRQSPSGSPAEDETVRAVVLSGAGARFCGGGDVVAPLRSANAATSSEAAGSPDSIRAVQ